MIAFYYIFRFFSKTVSAIIGKKVVEKAVENMQKQQQQAKMLPGKRHKQG
jgi:hypothetical protein